MVLAAPAGSSADPMAPAGRAVQLGDLNGIAPTRLNFAVTIYFLFSTLDLLLMRTPSDPITHLLNNKNFLATLFPLVLLISFFFFLP